MASVVGVEESLILARDSGLTRLVKPPRIRLPYGASLAAPEVLGGSATGFTGRGKPVRADASGGRNR